MHNFSIHIDQIDVTSRSRLEYTLQCINIHPFAIKNKVVFNINGDNELQIEYSLQKTGSTHYIPRQNIIFSDNLTSLHINEYVNEYCRAYSVEAISKSDLPFINESTFSFDIFETIFFHLSRYEERFIKQGDYLDNKLSFENQLLLVKNGLEKIPVVDELINAFLEILTGKKIEVQKCIHLTHDIDYLQKFNSPISIFRKIAGHFRHKKPFSTLPLLWKSYLDNILRGKDSYDNFDWMLSKKDIDKSIYFLVGGNHKDDNHYDLNNPIFKNAIRLAKERNYRIGIHPSYESWNDISLIKIQKEKLENEVGEEIVVSRQHFLNFDIEITPRLLQEAGIKEDSSLGYTRYVGYRCGTGYSYTLYDFKNEKAFDVLEKPLVFMDVAWFYESIRTGNHKFTNLEELSGSFNFHNSTFDEMAMKKISMKEYFLKYF